MLDKERILNYLKLDIKELQNKENTSFGGNNCCREFGVLCAEEYIKIINYGEFDIPQKPQETCKWKLKKINDFYICDTKYKYKTECDNFPEILDDLVEVEFKWCPYCGKPIEEVKND